MFENVYFDGFHSKRVILNILFISDVKIDKEVVIEEKTNWNNMTLDDFDKLALLFQNLQV